MYAVAAVAANMVGLKKFFHVDNFFQSTGVDRNRTELDGGLRVVDNSDYGGLSSGELSASDGSPDLPDAPFSQRQCVDHQYLGIEKQFEEMHEQFRSRQLTPRHVKYTGPRPFPSRNARHVDVLKAIFYSHREPAIPPANSPAFYNEDIADRNLNAPQQQAEQSQYACIVSAIYQEDVADRNILNSGSPLPSPMSGSSGPSWRFNSRAGRGTIQSTPEGERHRGRKRSPVGHVQGGRAGSNIVTMSEEDLRSSARAKDSMNSSQRTRPDGLRFRSSEPNLSATPPSTVPGQARSRPLQRPTTSHRPESSRKNVLDLSINTKLAAAKPSFKIDHCAVQPPATTPIQQKSSPSLAEIVNSPLPIPTPSPSMISPNATATSYSVDEIMTMFRQAYASSQANNQNPTFESLQNAIIREINSHDAFRELPPSSARIDPPSVYSTPVGEIFKNEDHNQFSESMRTNLLEEGRRLADHTRRGSPLRRRGSDTSGIERSLSGLRAKEKSGGPITIPRRRRHTYDQPRSGTVEATKPFKSINPIKPINEMDQNLKVPTRDAASSGEDEIIQLPCVDAPPPSPYRAITTPTADIDKITATIPMEPRSPPVLNFARTTSRIAESPGKGQSFSKKTRYHTSPFPIGRKRIPLRRSSLYKDLYDSGRLAP